MIKYLLVSLFRKKDEPLIFTIYIMKVFVNIFSVNQVLQFKGICMLKITRGEEKKSSRYLQASRQKEKRVKISINEIFVSSGGGGGGK
jgi:hypothetical protein